MQAFRTISLGAVWLLLGPTVVCAQLPDAPASPSQEDVLQARDAFVRGMEFAGEQRFEDARREFVHSYALSGSPVALFNLASTLRSLEAHREAGQAFERLLANPDLDATIRSQAEPMYVDVVVQIARIRLHGDLDGATLRVDRGAPRSIAGSSTTVVVDPGQHDLRADRAGAEPWSWSGVLDAGDSLDLLVELAVSEAGEPTTPGTEVDVTPVIAVGVSVGLAVAVIAIIVGVVVDSEAQLGPRTPLVLELP